MAFVLFFIRKCSTGTALLKLEMFQKNGQRSLQTLIQSHWVNCEVTVPKSTFFLDVSINLLLMTSKCSSWKLVREGA